MAQPDFPIVQPTYTHHAPSPAATNTSISIYSPEPLATAMEVPTKTPPTPNTTKLVSGSVYNSEQLARLQAVALKFQAGTPTGAVQVAQELGYLGGGEHPSTMGGPLSIEILRRAGFINAYVDLHDFWMLNPRLPEDTAILETIFPRKHYLWYLNQHTVREFDFRQFPLLAGDFLYLFAGEAGTFEQMCTVSWVDSAGRS